LLRFVVQQQQEQQQPILAYVYVGASEENEAKR
jgi:hypothetical protein